MKMQEIARLAGVSSATVSRVLNEPEKVREATRRRVQQVLDQTHYLPNAVARGLAGSATKTVGILANDITSLYIATVVYAIERRFTDFGYNVILANTGTEFAQKQQSLKMLLAKQVDGIVMVGSMYKERIGNGHTLEAARQVPVMLVNCHVKGENVYSILCDDAAGVRRAVAYLAGLGHRHIWYLMDSRTPSALAKLKGFQEGMAAAGLEAANVLKVEYSMAGGELGLERLLKDGKTVSAVICGEDLTAVGALKACRRLNLSVPRDLAVIGYNNTQLAEAATPTLTSVDNQAVRLGRLIAEGLYDRFQGRPVPAKTVYQPELFIRESTGPVV